MSSWKGALTAMGLAVWVTAMSSQVTFWWNEKKGFEIDVQGAVSYILNQGGDINDFLTGSIKYPKRVKENFPILRAMIHSKWQIIDLLWQKTGELDNESDLYKRVSEITDKIAIAIETDPDLKDVKEALAQRWMDIRVILMKNFTYETEQLGELKVKVRRSGWPAFTMKKTPVILAKPFFNNKSDHVIAWIVWHEIGHHVTGQYISGTLVYSRFLRKNEINSDKIGARIAKAAWYDPVKWVEESFQNFWATASRTHPWAQTRIQNIRNMYPPSFAKAEM